MIHVASGSGKRLVHSVCERARQRRRVSILSSTLEVGRVRKIGMTVEAVTSILRLNQAKDTELKPWC